MQNIQPLDFRHRGGADADFHTVATAQCGECRFALGGREFFRVVELLAEAPRYAGGKHHGSGHDRTGQRAASRLVDAGDASAMFALESVVRHARMVAEEKDRGAWHGSPCSHFLQASDDDRP